MKKLIGYPLLLLTAYLLIDQCVAIVSYFGGEFGFWGGLLSFSLLPISLVLLSVVWLFTGNIFETVFLLLVLLFLYISFKLLSPTSYVVKKPMNKNQIPKIDSFDVIRSLFIVPVSYYTILFSTGLTVGLGSLLIFAIYYGESYLIGRVHTGILLLIGIGIAIGVFYGIYSMFTALFKKKSNEYAISLTDKSSGIYKATEEVAKSVNTKMPDWILLSFNADFHVQQNKVVTIDGKTVHGRILTIGVPYLRHLDRQEFKAIVAHELAHFTGKDTWFSIYTYPTYKAFITLISNLGAMMNQNDGQKESNNGVWMALPNFIPLLVISRFYNQVTKYLAKIDRIREARADIISAYIYGSNAFSQGLTKISRIGLVFGEVASNDYYELVSKHDKVFTNYYEYFDKTYLENPEVSKHIDSQIQEQGITSELDTHFSLKERLVYLPDYDTDYLHEKVLSDEELKRYEEELSTHYGNYMAYIDSLIKGATASQVPSTTETKTD